jgi:Uma2 family endonuclease
MAAMVSTPTTGSLSPGDYVPTADERIVLRGQSWTAFRSLLALRGDRARPRMAYLDGEVELMGTSRGHEGVKGKIGPIVQQYCFERGIPLTSYGNWLLDDASEKAGAEPDDCYVFGAEPLAKGCPDLVIEVVWTRGGLDKLESYRRLGLAEVWFWTHDELSVHVLVEGQYETRSRSACLPELDLDLVCRLVAVDPLNEAIRQLREAVDAKR